MDNKCEFSQENEFGRLICGADNNLPCKYQRYCTKNSKWENTKNFSSCGRRISMREENKISTNKEVEVKNSTTEKKNYENKKPTYSKQKNSKKAEVILINKNYIVVKDENGCGIRKYGSFPDVKIGDFIVI